MDWERAIEINRQALERVIAGLFAMAASILGHTWVLGRIPASMTLPRNVHAAIILILRPAESAVRRLIIIAARGIVLKLRLAGKSGPGPWAALKLRPEEERSQAFQMIDPLKQFGISAPGLTEEEAQSAAQFPRISVPGFLDPVFPQAKLPSIDGALSAAHICRRLLALRDALDDLPRQARRLVRWQARQKLIPAGKLSRLSPFRPGRPPGFRQRGKHEIDAILRECHGLACDVWALPAKAHDTS